MIGPQSIKMMSRDLRAQATLLNSAAQAQDKKAAIACLDGIESITMKIRKSLE